MELKLSETECNALIELLYLGNWMANSIIHSDKKTERYEELFDGIFQRIRKEAPNEDDLYEQLKVVIESYDSSILLSEFSKQYADYKYPIDRNSGNSELIAQYAANSVLKEACVKELQANGFKNVSIDLPDLSEIIRNKIDKLKTN